MADLSSIAQLASPTARRLAIDASIETERQQADPADLKKRKQPRLSISELNALDLDQVHDRFVRTNVDTRTPFVRFLDMVDLPRNAVANAIASFTAPQLQETTDRAAAGLARINFSDFLREIGVENRVVRGAVGFVGDVALDPLTYLGGAGVGLQVASRGGSVARVGLTGARQLRRGIRATSRGRQTVNPVVRQLIEGVGVNAARVQRAQRAGLSQDQIQTIISRRVLGRPTSGRGLRDLGRGGTARTGALSEALDTAVASSRRQERRLEAAKQFLSEFAVGSGRRGIGPEGGTTVARVPFTDAALRVPGFTAVARTQQGVLAAAGAGVIPEVQASADLLRSASESRVAVETARDLSDRIVRLDDAIRVQRDAGGITEARERVLADMRSELDTLTESARDRLEESRRAINRFDPEEVKAAGPAAIVALGQQMRAQQAMADSLFLLKDREFTKGMRALRNRLVDSRDAEIGNEFNAIQEAFEAGEITNAEFRERGLELLRQFDVQVSRSTEKLGEMSDLGVETSLRMADLVHAQFETTLNLADALQGSVASFLTASDNKIAEVAKQQLGLGEGALGASLFAPLRIAAGGAGVGDKGFTAGVLGQIDAIERAKRRVFGVRGGEISEATAALRWSSRDGRDRLERTLAEEYRESVGRVLSQHNLAPDGQDGQDANDLLHIFMHLLRDDQVRRSRGQGNLDKFLPNTPERIRNAPQPSLSPEFAEHYTPIFRRLLEIQQRAFGDPKTFESIFRELGPIADDILRQFDEAGEIAHSEAMLSSLIEGYIPRQLTPLARESVRVQSTLGSFRRQPGASGGTAIADAREAFQKRRSTNVYRFTPSEDAARRAGLPQQEYEFYEFERHWLTLTPEDIDFIRTRHGEEAAAEIARANAIIRAFDQTADELGVDELVRGEIFSKPADVFRLNDEFRRGRFAPLAASSEIGDFLFETDVPTIVAGRIAAQHGVEARAKIRELVTRSGLTAPVDALASRREGTIVFTNGVRGTVISGPGGRQMVRVGGENFRQVDPTIVGTSDSILSEGLRGSGYNVFLPEAMADAIENTARVLSPTNRNDVVRTVDSMTNAWKSITLTHPSWIIANVAGSTIQALQGSMAVAGTIARNARDLVKTTINLDNREWLESNFINIRGRGRVRASDLVDDAMRGRVLGTSRTQNLLMELVQDGRYVPFSANAPGNLVESFRNLAGDIRSEFGMAAQAHARARGGQVGFADRARATRDIVLSDRLLRRVLGPWFSFNQRVEESIRLGAYIGHLERGLDSAQAAQQVRRTLFDYGDLTQPEQQIFRRLFPFYCVPDDSEILTRDGWKSCDDLVVGEEVLSFDSDTGRMKWTECLDKAIFDHDQYLEVARSARRELRYTPNHRWVVESQDGKSRKIVPAHDMNTDHRIVCAAELADGSESLLTPEQARLYGWLVTDGYWRFRGNHCEAVIYQASQKFLHDVVEVAGNQPRQTPHPNGTRCCSVASDRVEPLADILRRGKEYAPSAAARLSRPAAQAMWDAVLRADGSSPASQSKAMFVACAAPHKKATVQVLAALLGYRTTANGRGVYVSKHGERRGFKVSSFTRTMEHYKGRVWCPKTKNGTWVMRQGNVVTITGNTWIRNSGAFQLSQMMENPSIFSLAPKLKENLEEAMVGESAIPEAMRPNWMREQLAVMVSDEPGRQFGVLTGQLLPTETASQIAAGVTQGGGGLQDLLHYFTSAVNPVVSVPAQIGAGVEFFTGRSIGDPRTSDLGRAEFAAGAIRPLRELGAFGPGDGPLQEAAERGPASLAGRLILGGRVQSFDPDRIGFFRLRELQDLESGFRRAINRLERDGLDSTALRAQLMRLYQDGFIAGGFEDEVPVWAREQLAELRGAQQDAPDAPAGR